MEREVRIHDRHQFEMKSEYRLQKDSKRTSYEIDTFLFIPKNLMINPSTYSKKDFYNDLKTHMRFKTPEHSLKDLASDKEGVLRDLRQSVEAFGKRSRKDCRYKIKMFCCIFKSAIRNGVNRILKSKDKRGLMDDYASDIRKIMRGFRELEGLLMLKDPDEETRSTYSLADEFMSHLIETNTYALMERSRRKKAVLPLVEEEIRYRERKGYSVPSEKGTNEGLLYRRSMLKKFTENILFLETSTKKEGVLLEQMLFGLAAGLAMLFWVFASLYSQRVFGAFTLPFFLIVIFGYVFKDRIKELFRQYFNVKLRRALYDHRTSIFAGSDDRIGVAHESVGFVEESKMPETIRGMRRRDHATEIESMNTDEDILLYRKKIDILNSNIKRLYHTFTVSGLIDIMRMDISRFLSKMDDPQKALYVYKKGDYSKRYGRRVYHVNLVVRYLHGGETLYKRFRMILDRKGIQRIEPVSMAENLCL